MKKIENKTIIKAIFVLIAIFTAMVIFPHVSNADSGVQEGDNVYGLAYHDGAYWQNTTKTLSTLMTSTANNRLNYFWNGSTAAGGTSIFSNNDLYCVQAGKRLYANYEYAPYVPFYKVEIKTDGTVNKTTYKYNANTNSITGGTKFNYVYAGYTKTGYIKQNSTVTTKTELELTGKTWKQIQGYLYLLSLDSYRPSTGGIGNRIYNPKQLAVWVYISEIMSSNTRKVLGLPSQNATITIKDKIGNTPGYLQVVTTVNESSVTYGGNNTLGKDAYLIYQKAVDTYENGSDNTYCGNLYSFQNAAHFIDSAYGTQQLQIDNIDSEVKTKNFKFKIHKVNESGTALEGAEFKVTITQNGKNLYQKTKTTNSSGDIITGWINVNSTNDIEVVITETESPEGYDEIDGTLKITYQYSSGNWVKKTNTGTNDWTSSVYKIKTYDGINGVEVKNTKVPSSEFKFNLTKYGYTDKEHNEKNKLEGAEFEITVTQDGKSLYKKTVKTNDTGKIDTVKVETDNTDKKINVTIKETKAPKGYKIIKETIKFEAKYDATSKSWYADESTFSTDEKEALIKYKSGKYTSISKGTIKIQVANDPNIPKVALQITKFSKRINQNKEVVHTRLNDVTFNVKFEQQDADGNYTINLGKDKITTSKVDGNNGIAKTKNISPENFKTIKVTIEEVVGSLKHGYFPRVESFSIYYEYDENSNKWKVNEDRIKNGNNAKKVLRIIEDGNYSKGTNTSIKIWIVNEFVPYLKLNVLKVDQNGNAITNNKIEKLDKNGKKVISNKIEFHVKYEQDGEILYEDTVGLTGQGYLDVENVRPISLKTIKITMKEVKHEGFTTEYGENNPIVLEFNYNAETNRWVLKGQNNHNVTFTESDTGKTVYINFKIKNTEIPAIQVGGDPKGSGFDKVAKDNPAIKVAGAEFTATFTQNGKQIASLKATSDRNGHVSFDKVQPKSTDDVTVKIAETKLPTGWTGSYSKTIVFKYNNTKKTWEESDSSVTTQLVNGTVHVGITKPAENIAIVGLTILKKDQLTGANLDGVIFNLTFDNVRKVGTTNATNGKVTISKEVTNGKIEIPDIEIADVSKNVTVKITEDENSVPANYKKLDGTITLTLKRNGNTLSGNLSKDNTVLDTEVSTNSLNVNGSANTVVLDIKNHEVINLSGQVWLDAQEGEKAPSNPDGKKDNAEKKVQGVKVHLYSVKENKIIATVPTDSNGKYAFNNVIKTKEGFQIYFEYNGILYNDVGIKGDSKAAEIDSERTTFNNRFKTIDVNGANDGTSLTYSYNNIEKVSKLNASADGSTPANSSIKAYTKGEPYKESTENIDCGLTAKYYDLSVNNLINNIEYTINGKTLKENVGDGLTTYDASIFYSDYYYRYDDYSNLIGEFDDEVLRKDTLQTAELEAYVTYEVSITNQNTHKTNNVSVDYTYDNTKYELLSINNEPKTASGKITLTAKDLTSGDTKEFLIKFKVKKDGRDLPSEIANPNGLTVETVAEITSYTTDEGALIDVNSQPGNGKEEDDLSKASVNFKLKEDAREISGNVAEDNNSDGILDSTQINDVVVQLIEIVQGKDGKTYEYIWQETYTGSNQVKARSTSNNVYTYTNKLPASRDGKYQFLGYEVKADGSIGLKTGFIPGNYVIRFIYGDGTTLYSGRTDLLSANVAKYNGQDYKSTIDNSYKQEWYSNANYDGKSTARDNEARRLEVMAFSTEIDGGLGVALDTLNKNSFADLNSEEKQLLKDYYNNLDKNSLEVKFAYRASKGAPYDTTINIPESLSDEEIFKTVKYYVSYKTWMCAETSKINVGEGGDTFTKVNFGLMERPKTKLVLEKHITALKITPNGTGVQPVIDASIDVKTYYDEDTTNDDPQGIKNGLATIASTRENRGFWKVETDIEELMQGAKLEVEYTYVVKNESDEDYLNKFLVSSFENLTSAEYKKVLLNKINEVNANNLDKGLTNGYGEWLGQFYYTGTKGSDDELIKSKADKLEQSINNNLSFNEGIAGESFVKTSENVPKNIYDKDGYASTEQIATIVQTATPTINLEKGTKDYSKVLRLETTLASSNNGEIGTTIPSYIAEITKYSNAAGRENLQAVPENLSYVHSDSTGMTMASDNEIDEFWGESIIISKPTGADKNTAIIITITAISGVAVIGVGIILIKKYVIKK